MYMGLLGKRYVNDALAQTQPTLLGRDRKMKPVRSNLASIPGLNFAYSLR